MVICPSPDVVSFSNIANSIAVIADLVIDDILAVTMGMTFNFPCAPSCGKRFALSLAL